MSWATNKHSSKFQGTADKRLASALYEGTMIGACVDEIGESEHFNWYGLIISRNQKTAYIVSENNLGFFDYEKYPIKKGYRVFKRIEKAYMKFCDHFDNVLA